jgi:hypothetical protein
MVASGRNVVVEGRVVTAAGAPIEGANLYYVDEKHRPLMMPGVGEHGTTRTDAAGRFRVELASVHSAIGLIVEEPQRCATVYIPREVWDEGAVPPQELVCEVDQ